MTASTIEKTDTFFIISNYNTDPEDYLKYCQNYYIYDQSTDPEFKEKLKNKYSINISFVQNTGHNISDYFRFFIDHYEALPERMMLAKGNMIGRHISKDFFEKVYLNKQYTLLYSDRNWKDTVGVAYQLYDGAFLEINNSWYISARTHKYFTNYNDFLKFLFKDPIIPEWVLFSPGACHIVLREQVRKYPKVFYENLMTLLSYTYFPSEAHQMERMMNIIFSGAYELNDHCLDFEKFHEKIKVLAEINEKKALEKKKWISKLKEKLKKLKNRIFIKCFNVLFKQR